MHFRKTKSRFVANVDRRSEVLGNKDDLGMLRASIDIVSSNY